jgi:hydroxyethylthiazole kinase-like sugar kinase family protein
MARNVSAADLWFDVEAVRARSPLVLNIGTRDPYWVDSMKLALAAATQRGIPSVLDPVGAGATLYRNQTLDALLAIAAPTVIRGNGSEIMSTAGAAVKTRGVDSSARRHRFALGRHRRHSRGQCTRGAACRG